MKYQSKKSHKIKPKKRRTGQKSDVDESEHLADSQAAHLSSSSSPGSLIPLQRTFGNQAVQRLLAQREPATTIQKAATPLGAHVEMREQASREALLKQLLAGEKEITAYTQGVCYDAAAYILYLRGLISFDQIQKISGQNWVPVINFTGGTLWKGQEIPAGSAVGFTRLEGGGAPAGFFHAGVSIGGTQIRAVNGNLLGAGWSVPADIAKVLVNQGPGIYEYDRAKIQVWYR